MKNQWTKKLEFGIWKRNSTQNWMEDRGFIVGNYAWDNSKWIIEIEFYKNSFNIISGKLSYFNEPYNTELIGDKKEYKENNFNQMAKDIFKTIYYDGIDGFEFSGISVNSEYYSLTTKIDNFSEMEKLGKRKEIKNNFVNEIKKIINIYIKENNE